MMPCWPERLDDRALFEMRQGAEQMSTRMRFGLYRVREPLRCRVRKVDSSERGWHWEDLGGLIPDLYRSCIIDQPAPPDLLQDHPQPEIQVFHLIGNTGALAGTWLSSEPGYEVIQAIERWAVLSSLVEVSLSDHAYLVIKDPEAKHAWLKVFPSTWVKLEPLTQFRKLFLYIGLDGIKAHNVLDRYMEQSR
jgi:hypothetical protein